MKTTKKILSCFALLLALAMVLSMAVTAFADAATPVATALTDKGHITILGSASGVQYTIYRIFDIAKVTPDGAHVFIVNEKWETFAEDEMQKKADERYFTVSSDHLKTVTFELGENGDDSELQEFAAYALQYAEDHDITYDGQSDMLATSGNYTTEAQYPYGYYIMVSNHRGNENAKYSLFVIDSETISVREKNSKDASIQKFVQEDSLMDRGDASWVASNAAEIGQPVNFKIVVTLAANKLNYVITDTMVNFEKISDPTYSYSRGAIPTGGVTCEKNGNDGFTVTLSDSFCETVEDGDTLTIYYNAELTAGAIIAGDGNPNSVVLSYKDGEETVTTEPESTITYTYQLNVNKIDEKGDALAGATFTLKGKDGNLTFTKKANENVYIVDPESELFEITTDATGGFSICGLDSEDEYVLTETAAPAGYILMDPVTVVLSATNQQHMKTITVQNLPGVDMPETGGMGTTIFYAIGGLMTAAALVLLITKKRMAA